MRTTTIGHHDICRTLRRRLDALVWALLPGVCILCRQRSGANIDLCGHCEAALPGLWCPCRTCAAPLTDPSRLQCAACAVASPPYLRAIAALSYDGPVIPMIHRLKFGGSRIDARVLGTLLADRIVCAYESDVRVQSILPVPLSRARLVRRGHNQAALLARWVGARLAIPVRYDMCRRTRDTPPQTGLTRAARLRNLSGAFAIRSTCAGLRVAVVDDVLTTGSTASALTRALLAAGAAEVHVWAAARTPRPHTPLTPAIAPD